jgi:hypothetical protein
MRFKLTLTPVRDGQQLLFNYQYAIQAWIYQLLHGADSDFLNQTVAYIYLRYVVNHWWRLFRTSLKRTGKLGFEYYQVKVTFGLIKMQIPTLAWRDLKPKNSYICTRLIRLVAYITHLLMGVASTGTGAKRCVSFFYDFKISQALFCQGAIDAFLHYTHWVVLHKGPRHHQPGIQRFSKNEVLLLVDNAEVPIRNSRPHSVPASACWVQYCIYIVSVL